MKELIFVRHAKSDWGGEGLKDIDRPLADRGYSDAYIMSEWYRKNNASPDILISSPATRALNTALIFCRQMETETSKVRFEDNIYESSVSKLLSVVSAMDNSYARAMLFGHNPSFTDICNTLSPEVFFDNVPTCGIVAFSFDVETWGEAVPEKARLDFFKFPKDFRNNN